MEFKKTFKLELSDYTPYNFFTLKRIFIMLPIISVCLVYLVFFREDPEMDLLNFVIYTVVITALSTLGYFALIKHSLKKSLKASKAMKSSQEITLNDTGVYTSGEFGNTNMLWQDIYKVAETKKAFYIYLLKMQALVIPKRLISTDENVVIRSIVKKSLPLNKYRLREM